MKELKFSNSDLTEIRYVSRLVRNKLKTKATNDNLSNNKDGPFNHDKFLERNFWGYVKKVINYDESIFPTFNTDDCVKHFKSVLAKINPNKIFQIPSWIPALPDPITEFDLEPPTYQQISNVIRKMKTSGSPSPLDQISIICFKRCPYLRTYLIELVQAAWLSGTVPDERKKACTILIHKKDCPITLQSVPLKVSHQVSAMRYSPTYSRITLLNTIFKKDLLLIYQEHLSTQHKWLISSTKLESDNDLIQRERKVIVSCVCLDHLACKVFLGQKFFLFLDTISIISSSIRHLLIRNACIRRLSVVKC